jgi:hypothetical protein
LPSSFVDPDAIYDPVRKRMLIVGQPFPGDPQLWSFDLENGTGWTLIPATGAPSSDWWYAAVVYDPVRDRVIVAGRGCCNGEHGVWTLSLDGPPVWLQMSTVGESPTNREGHSMVYDPLRDRLLLFGGGGDSWAVSDLWELSLADPPTWRRLTDYQPFPPQARGIVHASMVYDSIRDRLVAFGGRGDPHEGFGAFMDTTAWELPLGTDTLVWRMLTPSGPTPSGRNKPTAVFDAARDQMVIFGGSGNSQQFADVILLQFSSTVAASDELPARVTFARPYPNPVSGRVALSFNLPRPGPVRLSVFDLQGRRVAMLVDDVLPAGRQTASWSAEAGSDGPVPPGVYLAELRVDGERHTRRIVRIR